MENRFVWKGELVFDGGPEEFTTMVEHLQALPFCHIQIKEWLDRPRHLAGCFPFPLNSLIDDRLLQRLIADSTRMAIRFPQDIPGGIRFPHLHLEEEVVLLNRAQFKIFVGEVAKHLAETRVEAGGDYIDIMAPLAAIPIQLPKA